MSDDSAAVPLLETERLLLRPFVATDDEALHEAFGDPEAMRYWNFPPAANLSVTRRNIEWLMASRPDYFASWAVVTRDERRFLGLVNYHHREARDRRLEVGYILVRRYWRQGYMSEAVAALLHHCFEALRTHRVEALIAPENAASIRLVERLGFRCEGGPLRDRWCLGDTYRSVMVYGLLADEWSAREEHHDLS